MEVLMGGRGRMSPPPLRPRSEKQKKTRLNYYQCVKPYLRKVSSVD